MPTGAPEAALEEDAFDEFSRITGKPIPLGSGSANPLLEELRAMEVAHEVLGGGRIQFEPDAKTIHIYGHSMGFPWQGEYRHDLSATVCQEAYPDFTVTTSNEGY